MQAEDQIAVGEIGGHIATLETKVSNIDNLNGSILDCIRMQENQKKK